MVSEVVKALRTLSRPLRRQFWWPGLAQGARPDRPGVILVSFSQLETIERRRLERLLPGCKPHPLTSDELPPLHCYEHGERERTWFSYYRGYLFFRRTLLRLGPLWQGKLGWSRHLAESDDLARLYGAIVAGRDFVHLPSWNAKPRRLIGRLRRLLSGLETSRYELWVVDRVGRVAYLPNSLALPEEPLHPREVTMLARSYCSLQDRRGTTRSHPKPTGAIRLMSYNLHSCVGLDGRLSVERVAEILHRYQPDFVALQELDSLSRRSNGLDQLEELKRLWPSQGEFLPLMSMRGGRYGIGFLSRLPVERWDAEVLPFADQFMRQEPRGVIKVKVRAPGGRTVEILNTHLGLTKKERTRQIDRLLEECQGQDREAQVLIGDFNCSPTSLEYRRICRRFRAAQNPPQKTWFGTFPLRYLDYAFVRGDLQVLSAWVPRDSLTRVASDHLPLIVDLVVNEDER